MPYIYAQIVPYFPLFGCNVVGKGNFLKYANNQRWFLAHDKIITHKNAFVKMIVVDFYARNQ